MIPLLPMHCMLYAETHFRFFRLFPSLLYKRMPEVLFDMPRRLDPERDLPILLMLNDIHKFPAECLKVHVVVSNAQHEHKQFDFDNPALFRIKQPLSQTSDVYMFTIPRCTIGNGEMYITCTAEVRIGKKTRTILNDNFPTSTKLPFMCYCASDSLPGTGHCVYGDMHVHTHFSQSQVEFGAPVEVVALMARAFGLTFTALTDHSYDLECSLDNYFTGDSKLSRWSTLIKESERTDIPQLLLAGEEVSCLNASNNVVHLCCLGLKDFINGSADGARPKIYRGGTRKLPDVLQEVRRQHGIAFAAHPGTRMGLLQQFFLNRGHWTAADYSRDLTGIQGVNDGFGTSWRRARQLWIKELLKGHKLALVAGNDAHGDFNRYRCISMPFISIAENNARYFGCCKTGIYGNPVTRTDCLQELRDGKTCISTGPFLNITAHDAPDVSLISNSDHALAGISPVTIHLTSSPEYGLPLCLKVISGTYGTTRETILFSRQYQPHENYHLTENVSLSQLTGNGYLRAEAECKTAKGIVHYAATSPCYITV